MNNKVFHLLLTTLIFLFFLPLINLQAQILQSENGNWSVEIRYIELGTVNLYASTSEESKLIGHYYYLEKVLILNDNNEYVKFGWAKVIYPKEGFLLKKNLLTTEQKITLDVRSKNKPDKFQSTQNWKPYIVESDKEYSFIKKGNDFGDETVGIIRKGDEVLTISNDGLQNKEWTKIYYPQKGYVLSSELALTPSNHLLGIGFSYGFLNIPYEKNLKNFRNPIGGFIEYTKSNWDFLIRIGYVNFQSHLNEYILKNNVFYLQIQYTPLRIINNHIRFYVLAGGGYWSSSFQFTKYPSLTDYFPKEKDKGYGYSVGGGIEYSLSNFFIGVQYSSFMTQEATFGPEPKPGKFTNQYKLFIGSNKVEVGLGYRFEF